MEKFRNLGLSEFSIAALVKKGFEEPTEIQEKIIPILLQKDIDIIVQAQTGTGKTAAFGLAFIEKLNTNEKNVQAIVLVPTRELAVQVAEEINSLKGTKNLRIIPVYGGQSIVLQLRQLKAGVDVVVGTPGRIMDHLDRKSLNLSQIKYAVLDEADEMLNMGFIEDIEKILETTKKEKQLLMFSATMPDRIVSLAKRFMKGFNLIQAQKGKISNNLVEQIYFEVRESDKFEALCRIIDVEKDFYGIVFCRTKVDVDAINKHLNDRGYSAESLHGDIVQKQRETILANFKKQKTMILVATDVAARGIDVNNLTHVINYSLPQDPEAYIHRIGRTGRAGKEGVAITFVTRNEYRQLSFIQKITQTDIRKKLLPDINEIITIKKDRINNEIKKIVEANDLDYYKEMVTEIIGGIDATTAIAALLKYSFAEELDVSNYNEIKEIKPERRNDVDNTGKTRIFMTVGKRDNMTPKKLATLIEKETGINQNYINNIEIFDVYSFVTAGFEDAEIIIEKFKSGKRGRIVAEKASKQKRRR